MPTPTNQRLFCPLVTALIFLWFAVFVSADEGSETAPAPPATEAKTPLAKRWYTNLEEARRVANDVERPIMIVFR